MPDWASINKNRELSDGRGIRLNIDKTFKEFIALLE
jgi:hypothetical protein